uniref:Uncharacterized protein n=1 Tax=Biomphalaria glabrata TaxID=6526 RepID=A0A2C9L8W3_BIOGL
MICYQVQQDEELELVKRELAVKCEYIDFLERKMEEKNLELLSASKKIQCMLRNEEDKMKKEEIRKCHLIRDIRNILKCDECHVKFSLQKSRRPIILQCYCHICYSCLADKKTGKKGNYFKCKKCRGTSYVSDEMLENTDDKIINILEIIDN